MSFPSLSNQYNGAVIEEVIADLEKELADEQTLAKKLDETSSDDKLVDARKFLADNSELIAAQHKRLTSVESSLRKLVLENKRRQHDDAAYNELVTSKEYLGVSELLADMKAKTTKLHGFLVDEGVRGRPTLSSESSSSASSSKTSSSSESSSSSKSSKKATKSK